MPETIHHVIHVLEFTSDSTTSMQAYSTGVEIINNGLCSSDDLRFVIDWSHYMSEYGHRPLARGLAYDLGLLADTRLKRLLK